MEKKEKKKKQVSCGVYEVKCPECGRIFFPTPIYGWKVGGKRYCRYSCMRKEERRREEKRKEKMRKEEEKYK